MSVDEAAATVRESLRPESTGCTCYGAGRCPVCKAHAALDVLVAAAQAAEAEAELADEFRRRLIAAKTSQPDWTEEGWNQFIAAALADDGAAR
jgi:hypothetical protein